MVQAGDRKRQGRASEHVVGRKNKMRGEANGSAIVREKYIDIPCVRALRRENRFLSKCKFGYALDDANKWMRDRRCTCRCKENIVGREGCFIAVTRIARASSPLPSSASCCSYDDASRFRPREPVIIAPSR